jgi:hypothetical protein
VDILTDKLLVEQRVMLFEIIYFMNLTIVQDKRLSHYIAGKIGFRYHAKSKADISNE